MKNTKKYKFTSSIFREYDIRGIYKKELNAKVISLVGFFVGKKIKKIGNYVVVGYDPRIHSKNIFAYLASGLNQAGLRVLDMGMGPTPVNYFSNYVEFLIDGEKITPSASIMITGSHNLPQYNGLKITINKKPFYGTSIKKLATKIKKNMDTFITLNTKAYPINVKKMYKDYMLKEFSSLSNLDIKIVLDCGNGATGEIIRYIFDALGLNYKALFAKPDGTFPNHHPDPSVEENLKDIKKSLCGNFNIGFAYDGDGDRIAVLTKDYNVKGDILAILLSKYIKNPLVIGEVKCSDIMYNQIKKIKGSRVIMYKTGHSNLKYKLKETNASLAAEVSGHIFFNDRYFGYDDAIYTTLRVLEAIQMGLDIKKEIKALPKLYSTDEIKILVDEKSKFLIVNKVKKNLKNPPRNFSKIKKIITIDGVRVVFKHGWALVRASHTTPYIITRFESSTEKKLKIYEKEIFKIIKKAKKDVYG